LTEKNDIIFYWLAPLAV